MSNETPRLNLETFEQGDENWDHTDTVEAVDEHAIDRGPIEERPEEGEYDDELYHATDQRIVWRWDADAEDWKAASGLGSESEPVPGTTHLESVSTEQGRIEDSHLTGTSYRIFQKENTLNNPFYAINPTGEIVAGGPDALNVSDPTDFAEVLATVVNDINQSGATIQIGQGRDGTGEIPVKSTQTFDHTIRLRGMDHGGANIIPADNSLTDNVPFTIDGGGSVILRDIKFDGKGGTLDPDEWMDGWVRMQNVNELWCHSCEFRSTNEYGIKATGLDAPSTVVRNWFIDGSTLHMEDGGEAIISNNTFRDETVVLRNMDLVTRSGNGENVTWDLDNVEFAYPDEDGDPRRVVKHFATGTVESFEETVTLERPTWNAGYDKYYVIEVVDFEDRTNDQNVTLELTLEGGEDGDYTYIAEDQDANYTTEENEDSYTLIEPTATNDNDRHAGEWRVMVGTTRVGVMGRGLNIGVRQDGKYLYKTKRVGGFSPPDPFDLTLSADAGTDNEVRANIVIYEVTPRSQMRVLDI